MLTTEEYRILNRARSLLLRCHNGHRDAALAGREGWTYRARYSHGRASEAAEMAEHAVFRYLNVAGNFTEDPGALAAAVHVAADDPVSRRPDVLTDHEHCVENGLCWQVREPCPAGAPLPKVGA